MTPQTFSADGSRFFGLSVILAKAGIQVVGLRDNIRRSSMFVSTVNSPELMMHQFAWIPAFAAMTGKEFFNE
jgi:hypothetical protein